jgi:hypothetical protein
MAYKVTITYAGVAKEVESLILPVCRLYRPNPNYSDSPAYEGSVYNTNTPGMGSPGGVWNYAIDQMEPFATTSIPFPVSLAQFKLAVVGKDNTVTFTVEDYLQAFYYMQIGVAMADQGFRVTVEDLTAAVAPDPAP